jgi:DNA-directed RNA polymerase I, II, and III subunit RPABC5
MIIPIVCTSCGKVLGDKWRYFQRQLKERKENTVSDEEKFFSDTLQGKILDELNITKQCCRRHMLTHVDFAG